MNYTNELRTHHLKATPQRLEIAKILHTYGHVNLENLYELMLKNFSQISLATIYKNINLMLQNYFITEVKIPNAKSVYEITKESHSHLVCLSCESIEDVNLELESAISNSLKNHSFQIQSSSLVLSGYCKKCN